MKRSWRIIQVSLLLFFLWVGVIRWDGSPVDGFVCRFLIGILIEGWIEYGRDILGRKKEDQTQEMKSTIKLTRKHVFQIWNSKVK